MAIEVKTLVGYQLQAALPELARLRIEVFREFPYLYDGTLGYEARYLERLAQAKDGIIVAVRDGDSFVGCATGAALSAQYEEFQAPFIATGHNIDEVFYFGESVLLSTYRGRGLGHAFFDHRENHAKACGHTSSTFCAVIRDENHFLKPSNYRTLHGFWHKRGYGQVEGFVTTFSWKDIDQPHETEHTMQFWMREIA